MSSNESEPRITLERDAWRQLVLVDAAGRRYAGVEPVRAFPLSDPRRHISLCDAEGREILVVRDLDQLPQPTRAVLEEELAQREFVPVIQRILNSPPDSEPTEWEVETDRGRTTFQLESEDDVYRDRDNQVTIVDSHGVRYLVHNPRKLDAHSRRMLDRFL